MKIAALISGGKDSIYALDRAMQDGENPACIVAIKSKNPESYMFHVPAIDLVKLQAEAMNIPLIWKETAGEKEKELADLKAALKEAKDKYGAEGVVSGALASTYQRERIESICVELGMKSITPLWHIDPEKYMDELLSSKYEIIINAVAADGLGKDWLGKVINKKLVKKLKAISGINLAGEGGEFETLVLDCPLFKQRLRIAKSDKKWDEKTCSGELVVKQAKLVKK